MSEPANINFIICTWNKPSNWKQGVAVKNPLLNPTANGDQMNDPAHHDEDEDQGDVFIDENDVVQEITVDDEGESIPPSFFLSIFVCVCVCVFF